MNRCGGLLGRVEMTGTDAVSVVSNLEKAEVTF